MPQGSTTFHESEEHLKPAIDSVDVKARNTHGVLVPDYLNSKRFLGLLASASQSGHMGTHKNCPREFEKSGLR